MKYTLEKNDTYTLLKIGEDKLDSLTAPQLKSEFVKINTNGEKNIILDLSQVKYVDSSGLSAILVGNRLCSNSEGKLILVSINDHVDKLLTISQLKGILEILASTEDAIEFLHLDSLEKNLKEDASEETE